MIGAGSASPVVSTRIRENAGISPRSRRDRRSRSVCSRSLRNVQHTHPLASTATSPSICSTSRWSSATSPNSLMMTALSPMPACRNSLLSKVVLPLPRNPVITETGRRDADLSVSNNPMLDSLDGLDAPHNELEAPPRIGWCPRLVAVSPALYRHFCQRRYSSASKANSWEEHMTDSNEPMDE